jgi:hypothetical protein
VKKDDFDLRSVTSPLLLLFDQELRVNQTGGRRRRDHRVLWSGEVGAPGVWLAEQVIAPEPFLARLAAHGILPITEELAAQAPPVRASTKPVVALISPNPH